jgi:hypothetical protein
MREVKFEVKFSRGGVTRKRFTTGGKVYGLFMQPDIAELTEAMGGRYRKAIERGGLFWRNAHDGADWQRLDLRDYRGRPMGTIFARQVVPA